MKNNILFLVLGILLGLLMGITGAWSLRAKSYLKSIEEIREFAGLNPLYNAKSDLYFLGLCHEKRYSEVESALEKGLSANLVMAGDLNRSRNGQMRKEYEKIAKLFKSYYLMKGVQVPMAAPLDLFLQDTPSGDPAAFKAFMEKPDL